MGALGPRGADDLLVVGLPVVDRVEGLVGQTVLDARLGVSEPHEHPQHSWRLLEVVDRGDDLARDPVREEDLDAHGAPPQRVADPVVASVPEDGVGEIGVVGVGERGER